jgi:hypothetical protein
MTVPAHGNDYADAGAHAAPAPAVDEQHTHDPGRLEALVAEADHIREQQQPAAEPVDQGDDKPAREYPDGAVAVPIEGYDGRRDIVHVLPVDEWTSEAFTMLQPPMPNYEGWAADCLALDDYDEIWCELRPKLKHVNAFFAEYRRLTGQGEQDFRMPRGFSRRIPKR